MGLIGEFLSLSVAILWTFTVIVFSEASNKVGSFQVNINRVLLSTLLFLIPFIFTVKSFYITSEQFALLAVSGIIGLVLGDTFLFKSFMSIGPSNTMLIMTLSPIFASIFGFIILREAIPTLSMLGIFFTLLGIALVVYKDNKADNKKYKISKIGFIYATLAALGQGVGLIFSKMAFQYGEIDGFLAAFIRISCSAIVFLLIGLLSGKYKNPIKVYKNNNLALVLTMAGAITGPFLGISLSLIAIKYTEVGIASTIMSIVPILMLPVTYFYYKEKLSLFAILGALLTVFGTTILFIKV